MDRGQMKETGTSFSYDDKEIKEEQRAEHVCHDLHEVELPQEVHVKLEIEVMLSSVSIFLQVHC